LRKPDKLTDAEFEKMKSHTVLGDEILRSIPEMAGIRPIVRSHHERWDGRGYPDNLAGQDIDLLARVVAVADSFDAMTTKRPYNDHLTRKVKSAEEAFAEVERCAGTQFDPDCAKAFLSVRAEVIQTMQSTRNSGLFSITGLNIGGERSASTATSMLKSVKRV
jgi:HD-GYP domain-containing protein (c-di-GMP phosphodiesterase class II)